MRYSALFILCSLVLTGCSIIKPTPSQEEMIYNLQQELQKAIEENATIQAGTQAYQENIAKIQTIQEQIQHYQEQAEKVQQQVQQVQEQVNTIKDSAQTYSEQSKLWIDNLKQKMSSGSAE